MLEVAALFMAAGTSSRMGGPNKLWTPFRGISLIVVSVRPVMGTAFSRRIAVTGRDAETTGAFLDEAGFETVFNPDFASGFGTSLAAGFNALMARPAAVEADGENGRPASRIPDGAMVLLADMPLLTTEHLQSLLAAFEAQDGKAIVRATSLGHPGNPVIIPQALFPAMAALTGEQSGGSVLATSGFPLRMVEIGPAAVADLDTPDNFAILQKALA
jgi:molybdenum cofactor cytidylyltransferase